MVKNAWKLTLPLFVLCVCGAGISLLLLNKHVLKSHGPSWFATVCGDEAPVEGAATQPAVEEEVNGDTEAAAAAAEREPGGANCDAVLSSRWGTIPPQPKYDPSSPEVLPPTSLWGLPPIPSAYLGFIYFTSLAIWFLFVGRATPDRPEWYRLPLAFNILGVGSALFFIFIMFTQTAEWCPWCMVTHVLNFLVLIGHVCLRPGPVKAVVADEGVDPPVGADAPPTEPGPISQPAPYAREPRPEKTGQPHPSTRLAMASILLSAAVGGMVWNLYAVKAGQANLRVTQRKLASYENDVGLLFEIYRQAPKVEIPIREDDPQSVSPTEINTSLVVFSDFECSWCRRFSYMLKSDYEPLFSGGLKVTWKHYPLCNKCNPNVKYNTHPNACRAARASEAARMQGGSEAFWKAHDLMFAAGQGLGSFDYLAMAEELGLDVERFEADMNSDEVAARIAEDIELAKSIGVKATPSIFLSGRKLEGKLVSLKTFWILMADQFSHARDQKIQIRRMQEEKARKAAESKATVPITQGTPSRGGAQ